MRAYNLQNFIRRLEYWGVVDVLLPFLLIFVIFYGILTKSKLLSENRGINVTVSVVIAALPVIFHVLHVFPARFDVIDIINQAIPGISLVAVAMICLLIFFALFGGTPDFNVKSIGLWTVGIVLLFVVNTIWYNDQDFSFLISMIILVVVIFGAVATGTPSLYDLVTSFSICFILYIFGRSIGWFSELPRWIFNDEFVGIGVTIIIMFIIIALAIGRKESDQAQT